MKNIKTSVLLLCFVLLISDHVDANECLRNVLIVSTDERSVSVAWDYSCNSNNPMVFFKVYLEHLEWKACPTGQKDSTRGPGLRDLEVRNGATSVDIDGLHPFSHYRITVKAITERVGKPEEGFALAETKQSVPDVAPVSSAIKNFVKVDRLKFYWRSPLPSECKRFNGELSGYHYILKGSSPWVLAEEERSGTTQDNFAEFQDLRPFTFYTLLVFSKTLNSTFNPDKALNLSERTLPSNVIGAPFDLKVERKNSETILSWRMNYPPTAEVGSYEIKWRSEKTQFLDINFPEEDNRCKSNSSVVSDLPDQRICFSIFQNEESLKTANLTFQVKAVSPNGIISSQWSEEIMFYPSNPNGDDDGPSIVFIIVVSVVSILFVVLFVTCISYHCLKRAKRYKNVPDYESGRRSVSFISTSTSGLVNTSGGSTSGNNPPPPYRTSSPRESMFAYPTDRTSVETTSTILSAFPSRNSSNIHQGFSLPTAQPRQNRLNSSLPRSPPKSQQPSSLPTDKIDTSKYQHLLLPMPSLRGQQTKRQASIQEQPLPPVPMLQPKEPIYEELCQDTLLSRRRFKSNIDLHESHELSQPVMMRRKSAENEFTGGRQDFPMTVRVNFGVSSSTTGNGNTEEEEEFLKPISGGGSAGQLASGTAQDDEDDDDYLKPRTSGGGPLKKVDSLEDEYLKPTFGHFERIDSRDLSPPAELPPPIPMQSYSQLKLS